LRSGIGPGIEDRAGHLECSGLAGEQPAGEQATGQRPDAFVFAAFEKAAPYACAFYYADDAMIEMGRAEYRKQLRVLADCVAADKWPGYTTDVTPLGLPTWALKAANDNQSPT
jgi:hypothetical protein